MAATTITKERAQELLAHCRTAESLRELGVQFTIKRRLVKMTNVQWNRGQLYDAKCHYSNRQEVSGNTYAIRDILKAAGFRWDAGDRVWWIEAGWRGFGELAPRIVRRLKGDGK